jgi:hypothetical protein
MERTGGPLGVRRPARGARSGRTPRHSRGVGQPGEGAHNSGRRGCGPDAEMAGARRARRGCAGDAARRRAPAPEKFHCAAV